MSALTASYNFDVYSSMLPCSNGLIVRPFSLIAFAYFELNMNFLSFNFALLNLEHANKGMPKRESRIRSNKRPYTSQNINCSVLNEEVAIVNLAANSSNVLFRNHAAYVATLVRSSYAS